MKREHKQQAGFSLISTIFSKMVGLTLLKEAKLSYGTLAYNVFRIKRLEALSFSMQ